MKKNYTIGFNTNLYKVYDRKQTIKELQMKHKERNKEDTVAEPDIDIELSLEHESLIRKILVEKNLITHDIEEDTM